MREVKKNRKKEVGGEEKYEECNMTKTFFFVFFFQAEDGIRDWSVTGVQTCALPISMIVRRVSGCCIQAASVSRSLS